MTLPINSGVCACLLLAASACASTESAIRLSTPTIVTPRASLSTVKNDHEDWPAPVHDDQSFTFLRAEQLEYRMTDTGPDMARWEAQAWHGGDIRKLWVKTEGETRTEGSSEGDLELQALYSQMIAPFWDVQAGVRYDSLWGAGPNRERWFGVLGVQGFSPYEFEVEAAIFVSDEADLSARLTTTTDFLITQRLIFQPRFESEFAFQDVSEFNVGQGLNYAELGFRLRYEIEREFAPYIGIHWLRNLGETDDFIREDGGDSNEFAIVVGLSMWL